MKINVNNATKLQAAIDSVQGPRISARVISVEGVCNAVSQIEKRLSALMLKKDWKGAKFSVDLHAQSFPNSYNGRPESTQFTLERGASGWFLTDIGRYDCRGPASRIVPIPETLNSDAILSYVKTAAAWSN